MPGFGPARTVPTPGQTVTSGSWTGPTPAPAPTGGQLAQSVGIQRVPRPQSYNKGTTSVKPGKGMAGYKDGVTSVPGVDPSGMQMPAPQQNPFAGGGGTGGGLLDQFLPGGLTAGGFGLGSVPPPVAPSPPPPAAALINRGWNPSGPAPLPSPNFGGATTPTPMQGAGLDAAFAAAPAALQATAAGQVAHPNGTSKADDNPVGTAAIAALTGARDTHAHAMSQPHQYTQDEFVDALRGVPLATIEKLWSMQHYQTPQMQIAPRFLQQQQNYTEQLQKEYDAINKAGTPQATLKAAFDKLIEQKKYQAQAVQQLALPNPYMLGAAPTPPGATE